MSVKTSLKQVKKKPVLVSKNFKYVKTTIELLAKFDKDPKSLKTYEQKIKQFIKKS
jgi:hypothetical protein